jgi:hypothetical protein
MKRALAGVAALVLVTASGCGVTQKSLQEKGLKPMTQKELEERYSRPVKVRFTNAQNQGGTAEYAPDGAARLAWQGGGATGKWRVKDGKFCTVAQLRGGAEACFTSHRTGPKEYVNATATEID